MRFLLHLVLSALSLFVVARIVPGIHIAGFGTALVAAVVFGLVNATVGVLLKLLTLPLTIMTLGLFLLVVNALLLLLASSLVPGFNIDGFFSAFLGTIVLAIVNAFLRHLAAP